MNKKRLAILVLVGMLPALLQGCLATSLLSFLPFLPKFTSTAVSSAHFLYTYAMDGRTTRDMVADKTITVQAKAALTQGGLDDAVNVSVYSYAGHVYLVGQLDSEQEIQNAVASVETISGVHSVTPILSTDQGACTGAEGYITAQRIHAATLDKTMLDTSILEVAQSGCDIVLLGMIDTVADANRILASAQSIAGPHRVRSHLIVTNDPALTPQLTMVELPDARATATVVPRAPATEQPVVLALSPAQEPAPTHTVGEIRYVNTAVNVRGSRTSKANVTARLEPGEQVRVRYLENNWFAVYATDVPTDSEALAMGYVFAPLLLRPSS